MLINASDCPIKAYIAVTAPTIAVESAPALAPGAFSPDASANIDLGAKTVTLAKQGEQRFYRLKSGSAVRITSIGLQGGNVVLKFQ
jgi:hypothetical protein